MKKWTIFLQTWSLLVSPFFILSVYSYSHSVVILLDSAYMCENSALSNTTSIIHTGILDEITKKYRRQNVSISFHLLSICSFNNDLIIQNDTEHLLSNTSDVLSMALISDEGSVETPALTNILRWAESSKIPVLTHKTDFSDRDSGFVSALYPHTAISKALHSTISHLGWTYVQVIVQTTDYYNMILRTLKNNSHSPYVCVLNDFSLDTSSTDETIKMIIQYVLTEKETKGVILLLDDDLVRKFVYAWNETRTESDNLFFITPYSSSRNIRHLQSYMLGWLLLPRNKFIYSGNRPSPSSINDMDSILDTVYFLVSFTSYGIQMVNMSLCVNTTDIVCIRDLLFDQLTSCCEVIPVQNIQLVNDSCHVVNIGEVENTSTVFMKIPRFYSYKSQLLQSAPTSTNAPLREMCRDSIQFQTMTSLQEADVYIIGVLPIHYLRRSADGCGELASKFAILTEVITYAVDYVNKEKDILPKLKLGYIVLDSCGSDVRVIYQLDKMYTENRPPNIIGSVGFFESSNNLKLAPYLSARNLLSISTMDSSSTLSDKSKYPYFFRMVPTNADQAKTIVAVLSYFHLTDIGIVYTDDAHGRDLALQVMQSLMETYINVRYAVRIDDSYLSHGTTMMYLIENFIAGNKNIVQAVVTLCNLRHTKSLLETVEQLHLSDIFWIGCDVWPILLDTISHDDIIRYVDGAVYVTFTSEKAESFESYMNSSIDEIVHRNPFVREYIEEKFHCSYHYNPYNSSCSNITDTINTSMFGELHLLNSVIAISHGTDKLVREYCPQLNFCQDAKIKMSELPGVLYDSNVSGINNSTFQFDSKGNGNNEFDIFKVLTLGEDGQSKIVVEQIGTWRKRVLFINDTMINSSTDKPKQTNVCGEEYDKCPVVPSNLVGMKYGYFEGDIMINVFLEMFEKNHQTDECSDRIKQDIFQTMTGIIWSVEEINKNNVLLPNIKLGLTIFGVCDEQSTRTIVQSTMKPAFVVPPPPFMPSPVSSLGIVGGTTDDVAISMDTVRLIDNEIPMIISASTSYFNNRSAHPRTFRTVLPASELMDFVLGLMQRLEWTYVHVIYDEQSKELFNLLEEKGKQLGACFASKYMVTSGSEALGHSLEDALQHALKLEGASAMIVMLPRLAMKTFFKVARRENTAGKLVFVIPDELEDIEEVIHQRENVALGMITVKRRVMRNNVFMNYFKGINLRDHSYIPWIEQFWQTVHQCNLRFSTTYKTDCSSDMTLKTLNIAQSPNTLTNINGVYSLAEAFHNIIHDCNSTVDVCISRNSTLFYQRLEEALDAVVVTPPGGQKFSFYNRNGTTAVTVQNLQLSPNGSVRFVEVGNFLQRTLTLDVKKISMYKYGTRQILPSKCPGVCNVCLSEDFIASYKSKVTALSSSGPPGTNDIGNALGIFNMILILLGSMVVILVTYYLKSYTTHKIFNLCVDAHACIIFGASLQILSSFVYLFDTQPAICGVQHAIPGCVYSVCLTGLLIKLNKNACLRELMGTKQGKIPRWDFLMTYLPMTTSAPVIIYIAWILEDPPNVIWTVPQINEIQSLDDITITWTCHFNKMEYLVFSSFCWLNLAICLLLSLFYNIRHSYKAEVSQVLWSSVVTSACVLISTCVLALTENHYVFRILLSILLPINGIVSLIINFMYQIIQLMKETNKELLFSQMMFDEKTETMAKVWLDHGKKEPRKVRKNENAKVKRSAMQWRKGKQQEKSASRINLILGDVINSSRDKGQQNIAMDIQESNEV